MEEKKKKGFRMPNTFTVLFIIIVIMAILTWIIPAGQYQVDEAGNLIRGTYERVSQNPQGFYDMLLAPVWGMLGKGSTSASIEVSFFILMVGGFLGVVNETGALDSGIASTVKNFKGREKMLIPVLMTLFALGGTTYGMGEETMAFYPLIVPVMIAVGFDAVVGVAIVLLGSQIGVLSSTVNPFATGVATKAAGITIGEGIIWRLIFFVVTLLIAIFFVYSYASKIEKDPSKSLVHDQRENHAKAFNLANKSNIEELNKKQKNVLVVFAVTFTLMVISLIPWGEWTSLFENTTSAITGSFAGGVLGKDMLPLGEWYFPEITMLFIFMSVVVAVVYGMSEERFFKVFMDGAADLLSVAIVVAVARGIQVIMNDGMITATILNMGERTLSSVPSGLFIVLTYIFYMPMSFLIPSTSGLASATMGIMAPLGEFSGVAKHLVVTAYQAGSGIVNLVTPTSGIVMGALALSHVEVSVWWKFMGKVIATVFVVSVAILWIATLF
ncbi:YfcC family protein [Atopobacter phocae]|uniref:YfcC family protein n=1 Tax=Atopobacter phocae TaxID=136492 RepID=UPI000471968D|nr:YfcC family protein [Atopobacter phocae]